MAALVMMAFSKACRVNTSDILKFSFTISTMRMPDICASTFLLESAAGIAALPGRDKPRDSTIQAMVDAVPMTAQCPRLRHIQASLTVSSSCDISPARTASLNRQISLVPMSRPSYLPVSIGPPETTRVGMFTLDAPITNDGVVLSQPHSNTTPSIGFARIDSSTSMLARFRYSMAVGLIKVSPSDMTGNSTGNPPASDTPRFTDSANSRKCALQGVSSDHVLQIPITGLPRNS